MENLAKPGKGWIFFVTAIVNKQINSKKVGGILPGGKNSVCGVYAAFKY